MTRWYPIECEHGYDACPICDRKSEPKMNNDRIEIMKSGNIVCIGEDATRLFAAMQLRCAMKLLAVGIRPTRGYNKKKAMAAAALYTRKAYGPADLKQAMTDLSIWIETMKAALPVVQED